MTKLLVCLLFAAAVVAANPYFETYLSEVSIDSAHQFVELHCAPWPHDTDLTNWLLITSTSACTLACSLRSDEFLVIDSEALASGDIGHGTFRLNPLGDNIILHGDTCWVMDSVAFPAYPTRQGSAPLPPQSGSISFWNYDEGLDQSMNWYVDSTPTPGWANDDYSMIGGTVSGIGGIALDEVEVVASGQDGRCHCVLYEETGYCIRGLGAGAYTVNAYVYHLGHFYEAVYPESVVVGYSQTTGGIDFDFPVGGVTESPSPPLSMQFRVSGRVLTLSGDGTAPVNLQLYNQVGSRVTEFHLGPISGEKRIELPATLTSGVYFAEACVGVRRSTAKVVLW